MYFTIHDRGILLVPLLTGDPINQSLSRLLLPAKSQHASNGPATGERDSCASVPLTAGQILEGSTYIHRTAVILWFGRVWTLLKKEMANKGCARSEKLLR
jgi:hypothetical protein